MSDFSLDVLQGYFDDLLTPEPQALETQRQWTEPAPLSPEPRPVVQVDTHPTAAVVDDLARQQLARLLASQPLHIATEIPSVPTAGRHADPVYNGPSPAPLAVESLAFEPLAVEPLVFEPLAVEPPATESAVCLPADEESVVAEPVVAEPVEAPATHPHVGWQENGRPAWAQERFDVLLFEVAGLTLAVPLMCLGQIQPLTDELTPLFGQADWFMGLQPTAVGKIRTINTARFVMPERYQDHFVEAARYVISIAGLPWGLAVDAVNQPITLHPDDVRWRSERSKRPWLAGTVKQHMCALLDIQTMGQLLQHAEQTRSRTDPLQA